MFADESILSDIAHSSHTKSIEKCVAKINRKPDELLDAGTRLYLTSICYFCVGCNLEEDNGHIFGSKYTSDITLDESYDTAYRLMLQAADLGGEQANYGLAVLTYVSELSKNKITKDQIAVKEIEKKLNENRDELLTKEELNIKVEEIKHEVSTKQHDLDFSNEIHARLLSAAKQGHMPSQFALSQVYSRGVGVTPDKVKAYAWAATAVAQNPPFGSERRDLHAVNMNSSELFEAESLADQYMKKYTNIFDRSSVTVMR